MEPYLSALMTDEVFENQAQAFIKSYKNEISTCPVQTCGQPPLAHMLAGPNGQTCIKEKVQQSAQCLELLEASKIQIFTSLRRVI